MRELYTQAAQSFKAYDYSYKALYFYYYFSDRLVTGQLYRTKKIYIVNVENKNFL